ncbi:winged helix-turn-helix domain-containing protein [Parvularcula maris]|uniref:Winged helix DNA-binding domain-containing protein n=1 Tax=Parvularcula maris TaxID=2965077 RepID=A0A9X2LB81_9PROT|nr:crosslink repair DNA glycosylase YcaQ family protein [Parvularcula maris]MCQ8186516.1 winged helix DNA-binding domain-containing protein [Parvularcula maris]
MDRIIERLGFVQLDTIQVVARAHHYILWSRNQNYREGMLGEHMTGQRRVFEHFTHDASVIPMDFYPFWGRQFRRLEEKVRGWEWHKVMLPFEGREAIKDRIRSEGPLCTKDFDTKIQGAKKMWSRPPHKLALDYLWYAGELSTSRRENFTKFYDLTERVIPERFREQEKSDAKQVDWLCRGALDRLAFGTEGDIAKFWDAVGNDEAKEWAASNAGNLVPVEIEGADGYRRTALAPSDIETRLDTVPTPTSRLRILNPFDPVIRDRARLLRLFGFEYTVEMFVPAAKRRWSYYVYPLLEGDRFVGRIEVKADRKIGRLNVLNLWPEPGVKWTETREAKLRSELERLARFVSVNDITGLNS